MGRGGHFGEMWSLSGILKIVETVILFSAVILHRHGDNGKYIFFGTSAIQMKANYYEKNDSGMDIENLGNGALVTFLIISPVLLICYVLDGRYAVQSLFLEWLWNFLGFILLSAVGVTSLIVWTNAKSQDQVATLGRTTSYARNYHAALAMGALCLIAGLVYFVDFVVAVSARRRFKREAY